MYKQQKLVYYKQKQHYSSLISVNLMLYSLKMTVLLKSGKTMQWLQGVWTLYWQLKAFGGKVKWW